MFKSLKRQKGVANLYLQNNARVAAYSLKTNHYKHEYNKKNEQMGKRP